MHLRGQRRRIVWAFVCALVQAACFAGSLSAIPTILELFVSSPAGPRVAIFQKAAEKIYGVKLEPHRAERPGWVDVDVPPHALRVRRIEEDSPFEKSPIREGDMVYTEVSADSSSFALYEILAKADSPIRLNVISGRQPSSVVVEVGPAKLEPWKRWGVAALVRMGEWMPDDPSPRATRTALILVFALLFAIVLLSNVCRYASEYLVIIASNRAVMDLRRAMYRTMMHLPLAWFGRHLSETMSRVVTDCKDVERGYRALFGKLMTEPIKIVFLIVVAIYFDWRITMFALIAVPIAGLIVTRLGKKIRKANRRLLAGYAQMMGMINATLTGMRVVRAHNNQSFERRRMWTMERTLLKSLLKIGRLESMIGPLLELTGVLIAMGGMIWLADNMYRGEIDGEEIFGLAVLMIAIFDSVRKITAVYPRLAKADGAAWRMYEIIDMPIEQKRDERYPDLPALRETLEFKEVTFTYEESTRPAIDRLSLCIRKGQKVALVGPNGSGKTTLIGLLERFFEPASGTISIDGHDIAKHSMRSLRDQISLITQDAVVFATSVLENIAYGEPGADLNRVQQAAQRAFADEFIQQLPDGYQTVLGEFGATLSGGQRQRLALARAIYRDAPIFILDEATSQVDVESERKIHKATAEFMKGRTSIVIAHRTATITDADLIVVLNEGKLVDLGSHGELLNRCGLYQTLYQARN